LIASLEFSRALLLLSTPFLLMFTVWLVIPVLFVLAAINSIVQPARQTALSGLVAPPQIGTATAIVTAAVTAFGAIGYGLAGVILAVAQRLGISTPTTILFVADAATFIVAGVLVLRIRDLGGGAVGSRLTGSLRRAFAITAVRPHLVIGTVSAFLLAISFPALVALAYRLTPDRGGATYSGLEVVLSIGLFVGSIVVSRFVSIGSLRTAGLGLLIAGIASLAMTLSNMTVLVALALLVASVGVPIYVIANQTALMEASDESNRGSVMASRFSLVQTASILGTAVGGFVTNSFGPIWAYGSLAVGLVLLGMFAVAAGRGLTNALHGRGYEDAVQQAANMQNGASAIEPSSNVTPTPQPEVAPDDSERSVVKTLARPKVNSNRA